MRKRRWFPVFLVLALLLPACGGKENTQKPKGLRLWFAVDESFAGYGHGPALDSEPYLGESPPEPEELMTALLAGPVQEGLRSPFPRGVSLLRCQWDEERPGVLLVDLSEQYGALADISLTLADYCVVLTLSQLEGVEQVEITAQSHWVSYRSHQQLSGEEAVLRDELAEQKTLDNPADSG